MIKFFLFLIFFYIFTLAQASFLIPYGLIFVAIAILAINFFEKPEKDLGIYLAFFVGLFLDFFSEAFFGLCALVFLAIAIIFKIIIRRYVRTQFAQRY